ncbi:MULTISPECIES: type VII secretion-associated serine protease mycosin [Streptomyces]|uniref:type VII secretion-associated serine protease mycosin n=1 Tax=Streptomyces TaxID=1883 RepID=UPI00103B4429|nr:MULTISPECIES: type VII secretion-associated serine protease mycosin [Streptomyces]MBT3078561.1 type VII secretion-associated serine protease mycosin [Streptomyces sp. COG21]MBT3080566.1 type VII secretion-associated serine protease mycosin [Streptomyces sp. COG20]MBT3086054.1 type VII secretion-associated serine protease mycosin [Streptomyces sp. CYG21]MBT3096393.1 type VII secretion-associated serine protease mycosin [Streptomyces sp. CBG30]MBT3107586.1 type VII secretion-associated serine
MTRRRPHRVLAAVCAAAVLALTPAAPAHADAIRDQQWALAALHTDRAWQTTKGAGITVAVLDTGVDGSHPDLQGQVLPGKDLVGFGATRGDSSWALHGTAMAGIIAGRGNGPGRADGVLGIAPEVRILPVRVILESKDPARAKARKTRGTALAEGIRWAADNGADVINLSLGDDSESAHPDPGEDSAIQYALSKGISVVASAGNGGEKGDRISYPAAYPGVIAVTAVDEYGTHASFSTRRWYATVSAPGVDIVVANPDGHYYIEWGTSAAAAFVSGAVALVRAAHPGLDPAQIKKLLADTARDAPAGGRDDARGYGMVDPAEAIEAGFRLRPGDLGAQAAPAGHREEYFGPGPTPPPADDDPVNWAAPLAGGLGAALLAAAVVLWRGRNAPGRY